MFFIASKILMFLLTPIVWVCLVFLYGFITRKPVRKKRAVIFAFVFLVFFSNSFILDEVVRCWEVPAISTEEIVKPYDYGIVLSGMMSYDSALKRITFHGGVDRLLQTMELYRLGKIKKIFLSGGVGSITEQFEESVLLRNFLVTQGFPEEDVLFEAESKNTYENAFFTAQKIGVNSQGKRYLLITSAFHMRRATACFSKAGLHVAPFSVNRLSGPRKYTFDHLFIPSSVTLSGWERLNHELFGYITYWVRDYL